MKKYIVFTLSMFVFIGGLSTTYAIQASPNYLKSIQYMPQNIPKVPVEPTPCLVTDGTNYDHYMNVVIDIATRTVTGVGGYPAIGKHTNSWKITDGVLSEKEININAVYTAPENAANPQTSMHMQGIKFPDGKMQGTWSDNYQGGSRSGVWTSEIATDVNESGNTVSASYIIHFNIGSSEYCQDRIATQYGSTYFPPERNFPQRDVYQQTTELLPSILMILLPCFILLFGFAYLLFRRNRKNRELLLESPHFTIGNSLLFAFIVVNVFAVLAIIFSAELSAYSVESVFIIVTTIVTSFIVPVIFGNYFIVLMKNFKKHYTESVVITLLMVIVFIFNCYLIIFDSILRGIVG